MKDRNEFLLNMLLLAASVVLAFYLGQRVGIDMVFNALEERDDAKIEQPTDSIKSTTCIHNNDGYHVIDEYYSGRKELRIGDSSVFYRSE